MNESLQGQIRAFFERRLRLKNDTARFDNDEPLFSESRLDSLDVVETIMFLEENFGFDFSDINYDLTLLDSVHLIVRAVEQKSGKSNRSKIDVI
jgi:acyl carrier protein